MAEYKKGKSKKVQVTAQRFVEVEDPTEQLPRKVVNVLKNEGLEIKVEKLSNRLLADQGRAMAGHNGCISNPGGPGC